MKILDGKIVRDKIAEKLKTEVSRLHSKCKLVIIQVGDNTESNAYINQKIKFGERIGVIVKLQKLPETISQQELTSKLQQLNSDSSVHGIIVQMPIPQSLDKDALIELINPKKDVDGLTSTNQKLLEENNPDAIIPATAKGVITILNYYKIPIKGKKVTVIGRSKLVGTPVASLLRNLGAEVTVGHSKTEDLTKVTKGADIIVVAVGKPNLITKDHVSPDQTIIDVGINVVENTSPLPVIANGSEAISNQIATSPTAPRNDKSRKLVGDVDFDQVVKIVKAITPVPGGVGPMTVASLFENLLQAYKKQGVITQS